MLKRSSNHVLESWFKQNKQVFKSSSYWVDFQSPWMGGAWESLIWSIKHALKVIVHGRPLKEESLYTFLCETESLVNSRPFIHVSDDPDDHSASTPNYILLSQESNNYSPDDFIDEDINLHKKQRAVQAAANVLKVMDERISTQLSNTLQMG